MQNFQYVQIKSKYKVFSSDNAALDRGDGIGGINGKFSSSEALPIKTFWVFLGIFGYFWVLL